MQVLSDFPVSARIFRDFFLYLDKNFTPFEDTRRIEEVTYQFKAREPSIISGTTPSSHHLYLLIID